MTFFSFVITLLLLLQKTIPQINAQQDDSIDNVTCIVYSSEIDFADYLENRPNFTLVLSEYGMLGDNNNNTMVTYEINDTCNIGSPNEIPIVSINNFDDLVILVRWVQNTTTNKSIDFGYINGYIDFVYMKKNGSISEIDVTDYLCKLAVRYKLYPVPTIDEESDEIKKEIYDGVRSILSGFICNAFQSVLRVLEPRVNETRNKQAYPPLVYDKHNWPWDNYSTPARIDRLYKFEMYNKDIRYVRRQEHRRLLEEQRINSKSKVQDLKPMFGIERSYHYGYDVLPWAIISMSNAFQRHSKGNHPIKIGLGEYAVNRIYQILRKYNVKHHDTHYLFSRAGSRVWKVVSGMWGIWSNGKHQIYSLSTRTAKALTPTSSDIFYFLFGAQEFRYLGKEKRKEQKKIPRLVYELNGGVGDWNDTILLNSTSHIPLVEDVDINDPIPRFSILSIFTIDYWRWKWTGHGPNDNNNFTWCILGDLLNKGLLYRLVAIRRSDFLKSETLLKLGIYEAPDLYNCKLPPLYLADPNIPRANCSLSSWKYCPDYITYDNIDQMNSGSNCDGISGTFSGWISSIFLPEKVLLSSILKPYLCWIWTPASDAFLNLIVFNSRTCEFNPTVDVPPGAEWCMLLLFIYVGLFLHFIGLLFLINLLYSVILSLFFN